ncbi:MAG: hypothetical protein K0S55_44 [Clostridia bacterium]|nr:hypothetical protein [Clostridia bacterium]
MKKGVRYGTVFFLVVATAFVTAIATYFYLSMLIEDLGKNQQMYLKLDKVNQVVSRNYINTIDPLDGYDKILDGIVGGYINGLGDSYSYYLNQKNYKTSAFAVDGSFIDIGLRYSFDNATGGIKVDFAKNGSPAKMAGIQQGDIIIAIDGVNVTEDGYRRAAQRFMGEDGSIVEISVVRSGESDILSFNVRRSKFESQTVEYRMVESGIGYVFINEFDRTTLTDFTVALDDLTSKGAKGLMLDVRFNSGGDLDSAISVLDKIMPASIIVSLKEKSSSEPETYFSDDRHISLPMVVIQNSKTAGVAEVFSAALRDTEVARIIGTISMGMGVGQRDIPLSDGTAIRLSTYEYITPAGERFNKTGIEPTITSNLDIEKELRFFELTDEEDDQLQTALNQLKEMMGMQ